MFFSLTEEESRERARGRSDANEKGKQIQKEKGER